MKHVIAKRFDNGGMRWIRVRAEALLQLRCIEINGDWNRFVSFVGRRLEEDRHGLETTPKLLTTTPSRLPQLGCAA